MTSEPESRSARISTFLKWLIRRLVRGAVPVDGFLWVDPKGCGSPLEDSAAARRPHRHAPAEGVTSQRVEPTDGSALG